MRNKFAAVLFSLLSVSSLIQAAQQAPPEPVYIVLYSRFYDHTHHHTTNERLQRLLPMLSRLRSAYPQSGIAASLQFSGTVSELLAEENKDLQLVDQIKDLSRRGLVDVGYTGEEEPSYLFRPRANLLLASTPEARWLAKAEAAQRFLVDFKNPVTGRPVPGLSGGLKRTLEVFGDISSISGVSPDVSADSAVVSEVKKLAPKSIMTGIPASDPKFGIEGFGFSAANFSTYMSPDLAESPEMFWEDGVLRLSDTSLTDNKRHTADEELDALRKVFEKLDRSHVRIIKIEVASYKMYLSRRPDGSVITDPLEWTYYHPDDPKIPLSLKPLVNQNQVEAGYQRDEATLKWLLEDFLPKNPGSRFISFRDLAAMPAAQNGNEVSADQLKVLANDLEKHFKDLPMTAPDFGQGGDRFFSLAESFNLFAQALAVKERTGVLPNSVALTPMYGPLMLPADMGAVTGSLPVSSVIQMAAKIAPQLARTAWKPLPDNMVPTTMEVGGLHLNASQLLRLMVQAYLDPAPDKKLYVNATTLTTRAAFMFPKNTPIVDQGNAWTFKPAPLKMMEAGVGPTAGGRE